jgi:O-acetyl-ADP-ribose deacetylase (regulator of RNase III)
MIELKKGDILKEETEAVVNTVNTKGVMGKGIALQFKERFPENYRRYKKACEAGDVETGKMFVTETGLLLNPRYVINFPTKEHWKNPSKMEYIHKGLHDLVRVIQNKNITSISIPPLGCGNGGLDWNVVRPAIENALSNIANLHIVLYEPSNIVYKKKERKPKKKTNVTPVRAMFLSIFEKYKELGFQLSFIEAHKLIYFLQRFGEPLDLTFEKNRYGPYSHIIDHMLYDVDGSFLKGTKFKDAKPQDNIYLVDENFDEIHDFVEKELSHDQKSRLNLIYEFIEGFESPLGLELLATVDYILQNSESNLANGELIENIYHWDSEFPSWGKRKKDLMKKEYIEVALVRIQEFQEHLQ